MQYHADTIREEAERWFARRRDGARMPDEEAQFRRWLQRSPRHAQAYAASECSWRELHGLHSSTRLRRLTAEAMHATAARPRSRRRPLLLAAGLAALALFAAWRLPPLLAPEAAPQVYATALGEQRSELLPDGSRMVLNTDTELQVHYRRGRREIRLRHGEALFEVAPDKRRPFAVAAADGMVTALGTRFQVRREAGAVAVTLLEGRVEVKRAERQERRELSPGERAEYRVASRGIAVRSADPALAVGWTQGRLDFQRTRLAEAVAEANRYSPQKLWLASTELEAIPVSGNFRIGDNAGIAAAFAAVFPVRVGDVDENRIVLLPAGAAR